MTERRAPAVTAVVSVADDGGSSGRLRRDLDVPVSISADVGGRRVTGQVAIAQAGEHAPIRGVTIHPADAVACAPALEAITRADQIVLAPGSLFTSLLAVLCVPEIGETVRRTAGRVVQVCNLHTENETSGLDGTDHLRVVREHGHRVDVFLHDPDQGLAVDDMEVKELDALPVAVPIAACDGVGHEPERLAKALSALL